MDDSGYGKLLFLLSKDPRDAERAFQELRNRLVRLFVWRGASTPEDLADETLSRVALRLAEGEEIRSSDPFRYCCGVAFRVFQETLRELQRQRVLESPPGIPFVYPEPVPEDHRMDCLEHCLSSLRENSRNLILRYYRGEGRRKIQRRQRLARELGIEPAALRNRAQRVRTQLVTCVRGCLRRQELDSLGGISA